MLIPKSLCSQTTLFQMGDSHKAATAAFTNLIANPDNEVMAENLQFYFGLPEIRKEDLRDREAHVSDPILT